MKQNRYSFDWWASVLKISRWAADRHTFYAHCPAHDDKTASLSVTRKDDGTILVHCFAGCSYQAILKALNDEQGTLTIDAGEIVSGQEADWEKYTGIPIVFWRELGCEFRGQYIEFTWPNYSVVKYRKIGSKDFAWSPVGQSHPPFWPLPINPKRQIWITEGETDCAILRYIGIDAYSLTAGANQRIPENIWEELRRRGVEEVVIAFDADIPGNEAAASLLTSVRRVIQRAVVYPTQALCDPFSGQKDFRDCHLHSPLSKERILALCPEFPDKFTDLLKIEDLLSRHEKNITWLVKDILLDNAIATLIGSSKMGKTWLALDLGLSVATRTPFMGFFTPDEFTVSGSVIYIPKEDTLTLLKDRIGKIMIQKGLGGQVYNGGHNEIRVMWPPTPPNFIVATSMSFSLNEVDIDILLHDIYALKLQDLKLIILDPVLRMIHGVDAWRAEEVATSIFQQVDRLRRELGCTVLMCHHLNKSSLTPYGSVGFEAFSENWIKILDTKMQLGKWMRVETRFKSAPDLYWAYRFNDLDEAYAPEVTTDDVNGSYDKQTKMEMLVDYIRQHGMDDKRAMAAELGISRTTLYCYLRELSMNGLIPDPDQDPERAMKLQRLKAYIQEHGLEDKRDMAKAIGVSKSTLYSYLKELLGKEEI